MGIRSGTAMRSGVAATTLAVVLSLTACSGDDDDPASEPDPSSSSTPPVAVSTRIVIGEVSGRLPPAKRSAVKDQVGKVVTDWIKAAYFSGSPRTDLATAFPGFTAGAERLARRDKWLMSNASLASNIDEVVPAGEAARVAVDLLAVKGRVVGATARFKVTFDTVAGTTRRVHVRGRVVLTRNQKGNWTIFGYDAGRWATAQKGARS